MIFGLVLLVLAVLVIAREMRRPTGAENSAIQRAKGGIVLPETVRKREQRAKNRADLAAWKAERQAAAQAPKAPAKPKAAKVPKAPADPPAEVTPLPTEPAPEPSAPEPTPEVAPEPKARKPRPESKPLVHREPTPEPPVRKPERVKAATPRPMPTCKTVGNGTSADADTLARYVAEMRAKREGV